MKRTILTTAVICVAVMMVPAAMAAAVAWDGSNNSNWHDPNNWDSCPNLPTSSDDVTIPDVTGINPPIVIVNTATAKSITINSNGTLTINSNGILTVAGDGDTSTIASSAYIQINVSGELRFTGNHTVQGDGTINGTSNDALATIADSKTLTSQVTIQGALAIDNVNTSGTFNNEGLVHANTTDVLELKTATIRDSTGNRWQVSTSGSAYLRFSTAATGSKKLVGNFLVGVSASDLGTLDIQADVTTSGTLDQKAGTTIRVATDKTFQVS